MLEACCDGISRNTHVYKQSETVMHDGCDENFKSGVVSSYTHRLNMTELGGFDDPKAVLPIVRAGRNVETLHRNRS